MPFVEKSRVSCPGDGFPSSFILQMVIVTGLNGLGPIIMTYVPALKMNLDDDSAQKNPLKLKNSTVCVFGGRGGGVALLLPSLYVLECVLICFNLILLGSWRTEWLTVSFIFNFFYIFLFPLKLQIFIHTVHTRINNIHTHIHVYILYIHPYVPT